MDLKYHKIRTKINIQEVPSSLFQDNTYEILGRRTVNTGERDCGVSKKRSTPGSSPSRKRARVLFPSIPEKETRRFLQDYYQFEEPKQLPRGSGVQDGNNKVINQNAVSSMLHGGPGPEGRVLSRPNTQGSPKIPENGNPHQGSPKSLPVHSPTIWPSNSPEGLYKTGRGGNGSPQGRKHPDRTISGRFSGDRLLPATLYESARFSDSLSKRPGLANKPREIQTGAFSGSGVPRSHSRLQENGMPAPREQDTKDNEFSVKSTISPLYNSPSGHVPVRLYDLVHSCGPVGPTTLKRSPMAATFRANPPRRVFRRAVNIISSHQSLSDLVDVAGKSFPGSSMGDPNIKGPNYGRKPLRVGSSSGRLGSSGHLVPFPGKQFLQYEGTPGRKICPSGILGGPSISPRKSDVRQSGSSILHKPSGGYPFQKPNGSDQLNPSVSREQPSIPDKPTHKGGRQLQGRLPQSIQPKTGGMGTKCGDIHPDHTKMGCSQNRSLREPFKQKSSLLLLPISPGEPSSCGRVPDPLGSSSGLCLSSPLSDSSSAEEDSGGRGAGHLNCPVLAEETLVLMDEENVNIRPLGITRPPGSVVTGPYLSSTSQELALDSLALERKILENRGFSSGLISTLLKSRKPVTTKQYGKIWKKFLSFSGAKIGKEIPINSILEFLQNGLDMGLATSTLKVHVAALGALFNFDLASNRWISRFIKAAGRSRPLPVKVVPQWDLNLVLKALTSPPFEPLHESTIKTLSLKTALLVALTSARRVSDLQVLSACLPHTQFLEDRVILKTDPAYLPKVASKFHRSQEISLPSFYPNPKNEEEQALHTLDVRRCLLHYLEVTRESREDSSLFVCFQGPRKGKKASKATIARWITDAISLSYSASGMSVPGEVKAHSTRAVATSWAEKAGASIDQICRAATWSSPSTFYRHYRLDLISSSDLTFGKRVLEAVVPP
ncbi:uncharacterized protein [Ranitomeya imitator]|uniref:uncharacterized protein isoform X1 n=1 Tax=Ranitomeya imitator TaxID=111125 RepID=UPI0037E987A9